MNLTITLIQPNLAWEDKEANFSLFENHLSHLTEQTDIVILPEMFSTGFTMRAEKLAEDMEGPTIQWLQNMTAKTGAAICGSFIVLEKGRYYNRLIFMLPDGNWQHYDKRHLFTMAGEQRKFSPGQNRLVLEYKGWKILPQVCYDLRFPVWARNVEEYDLMINIANWPEKRNLAWKTLLRARAIENQCFVAGLNRVGEDGNGISHSGDSAVIGPTGEAIWECSHKEVVKTLKVTKEELNQVREKMPFLADRDNFRIV